MLLNIEALNPETIYNEALIHETLKYLTLKFDSYTSPDPSPDSQTHTRLRNLTYAEGSAD